MEASRRMRAASTPATEFGKEARRRADAARARKTAQDTRKRFTREFQATPGFSETYNKYLTVMRARNQDVTTFPGYSDWAAGRITMRELMAKIAAAYDAGAAQTAARRAAKGAQWDAEDALYDASRAAAARAEDARQAVSRRRRAAREAAASDASMRAARAAVSRPEPGQYPPASQSGVNPAIQEAIQVFTRNRNEAPRPLPTAEYNQLVRGIEHRAKQTARRMTYYYLYGGRKRQFPVTRRAVIYYVNAAGWSKEAPIPQIRVPTATPSPAQGPPVHLTIPQGPPSLLPGQGPPALAPGQPPPLLMR